MKLLRLGIGIGMLAGGLLCRSAMAAEPVLTTIDDVLYKADGSLFEGILVINWKSFEGPGTSNIPTNSLSVQVRQGRLYTRLVPTTTAPSAAYYSVRYITSGSVQFTELWSVPSSNVPLLVRDVRIDWPPATTAVVAPATDITVADVEGLTEALDVRPVKGQSYAPARAAIIGATGDLEAAPGALSNCIRVDGSTGPCGTDSAAAGFVDGENLTGVMDGVNANFSLSSAPDPAESLILFRNGTLLASGPDYSLTGNAVTFTASAIPESGDLLVAFYRVIAELTTTYGFVSGETPSGTIDGVNAVLSLAAIPSPSASLQLYRNGLLQRSGVDYTLSIDTITFLAPSIPQAGDIVQAAYRTNGS